MKKIITGVIVGVITAFSNLSIVYAQNFGTPRFPNPTTIDSLEELINILVGLIRPVFIITFAAMIMYGAFVWMTAGDDDSKVARARKIIVAAIIGLSIAIFAPAISNIVAGILGIEGISTI